MALVYFDTSALIRLCVPESGSCLVTTLWNRADAVVTSRIAEVEVAAALTAAQVGGLLDDDALQDAARRWESVRAGLHMVEVSPRVIHLAAEITSEYREQPVLRAGDSVHAASAKLVAHEDTIVAAWDDRVVRAVRKEGLRVVP